MFGRRIRSVGLPAYRRIGLAAALTTLAPIAMASEKCDYAALRGEEFLIKDWATKPAPPLGHVYRFYTEAKLGAAYRLPEKGLRGTLGKILGQAPQITADGRFYNVSLQDCRSVFLSLPQDGEIPFGIVTDTEYRRAKSYVGTTLWAKQYGVKEPTIFTLDPNVSYIISDGDPLQVTGVFTSEIGHAWGAAQLFLQVRDTKGHDGFYPFDKRYLSSTKPTREELQRRARTKIAEGLKPAGDAF